MSIHHEVSVHCDSCGQWEYAQGRDLTKNGWVRYRNGDGSGPTTGGYLDAVRHLCPQCSHPTVQNHAYRTQQEET